MVIFLFYRNRLNGYMIYCMIKCKCQIKQPEYIRWKMSAGLTNIPRQERRSVTEKENDEIK